MSLLFSRCVIFHFLSLLVGLDHVDFELHAINAINWIVRLVHRQLRRVDRNPRLDYSLFLLDWTWAHWWINLLINLDVELSIAALHTPIKLWIWALLVWDKMTARKWRLWVNLPPLIIGILRRGTQKALSSLLIDFSVLINDAYSIFIIQYLLPVQLIGVLILSKIRARNHRVELARLASVVSCIQNMIGL